MAADLIVRAASTGDSRPIWDWRNDPVTMAFSHSRDPVPWEAHAAWFAGALADPARKLIMCEADGAPFAMVRFDRSAAEPRRFLVSINLRPEARGRGLGRRALAAACDEISRMQQAAIFDASIHETNSASLRIFAACDFVLASGPDSEGFLHFVRG